MSPTTLFTEQHRALEDVCQFSEQRLDFVHWRHLLVGKPLNSDRLVLLLAHAPSCCPTGFSLFTAFGAGTLS